MNNSVSKTLLFASFILAPKQFSIFCVFFVFVLINCCSLIVVVWISQTLPICSNFEELSFWISLTLFPHVWLAILSAILKCIPSSCVVNNDNYKTVLAFGMFRDTSDNSMDVGKNRWNNISFIHANLLYILLTVLLLLFISSDNNEVTELNNFGSIVSLYIIFFVIIFFDAKFY